MDTQERVAKQDQLIHAVIEGMDAKDLYQYAYDQLETEYWEYNDEEFLEAYDQVFGDQDEDIKRANCG